MRKLYHKQQWSVNLFVNNNANSIQNIFFATYTFRTDRSDAGNSKKIFRPPKLCSKFRGNWQHLRTGQNRATYSAGNNKKFFRRGNWQHFFTAKWNYVPVKSSNRQYGEQQKNFFRRGNWQHFFTANWNYVRLNRATIDRGTAKKFFRPPKLCSKFRGNWQHLRTVKSSDDRQGNSKKIFSSPQTV